MAASHPRSTRACSNRSAKPTSASCSRRWATKCRRRDCKNVCILRRHVQPLESIATYCFSRLFPLFFLKCCPVQSSPPEKDPVADPFTQKPPAIHNLTDICWKKCVPGAIKSNTLDRTEATCAANCVDRFMDANEAVLGHLQRMQRGG